MQCFYSSTKLFEHCGATVSGEAMLDVENCVWVIGTILRLASRYQFQKTFGHIALGTVQTDCSQLFSLVWSTFLKEPSPLCVGTARCSPLHTHY